MCKVNDYVIFQDEVIGKGNYGTVVKAQKASDLVDTHQSTGLSLIIRPSIDYSKKIYACKIYENEFFSPDQMNMVFREMKVHSMLRSENCIYLHQSIKTAKNVYMIQEYANCFDL